MSKGYVAPTAEDFKNAGARLLQDYEQNINKIKKDLGEELYTFPNIEIDNYIHKCVKARQNAFNITVKAHKALQWLTKEQGFTTSFDEILNHYLKGISVEQVTKRFTQDIQHYYKQSQNKSDVVLDIYQLQQQYKEKAITYDPYQEGIAIHGDYASFSNHFQDKMLFELISNLCFFYGDWLDGLYTRKAKYIKNDLKGLSKNLKNIHLIINQPDFLDCFPNDLLLNILPSPDMKQSHIERNSIKYLDELIEQYKKVGLRQDNHLERRLKIYDLARIIKRFYPNIQLTRTKLDHIIYKMMTTIPLLAINSSEEALTEKSIRDLLSTKNLNIILKQDIEHVLSYADSYEKYDDFMKDHIEQYDSHEEYNRNNPDED